MHSYCNSDHWFCLNTYCTTDYIHKLKDKSHDNLALYTDEQIKQIILPDINWSEDTVADLEWFIEGYKG
jgi:hypothetical protein